MRISEQLSITAQTLGRGVNATLNALHAMTDAVTGTVTVAVWCIAEKAGCQEAQARRDLHAAAAAGYIEIDINQAPDAMQQANTYRWIGVGGYESVRMKEWRLARRERQRAHRLQHNEAKRKAKQETLQAMIARRIGKGIREGIALYWQRHDDTLASGFAPRIDERALQETPYIIRKKSSGEALEEMRLRKEERERRR